MRKNMEMNEVIGQLLKMDLDSLVNLNQIIDGIDNKDANTIKYEKNLNDAINIKCNNVIKAEKELKRRVEEGYNMDVTNRYTKNLCKELQELNKWLVEEMETEMIDFANVSVEDCLKNWKGKTNYEYVVEGLQGFVGKDYKTVYCQDSVLGLMFGQVIVIYNKDYKYIDIVRVI